MSQDIDPVRHLHPEVLDEEMKMVLEDPYSVNFRSENSRVISFPTDDGLTRNAEVDLANQNAGLRYNTQTVEEKYVVVAKRTGLGIVESHARIPGGEYASRLTVNYHVITPELDLFYDGQGYVETENRLPRQTARRAPNLIQEAKLLDEAEFRPASELEPQEERSNPGTLPPPEEDSIYD